MNSLSSKGILSRSIVIPLALVLACLGAVLADRAGFEIAIAVVVMCFLFGMALMDNRIAILSILIVFTLNQTTIIGGTSQLQIVRWIVLGIGAIIAILQIISPCPPRKFQAFDLTAIVFLGVCFTSTMYSVDPSLTFQRAISLALLYLAVFWMVWAYANHAGQDEVLKILIFSAWLVYGASAVYMIFPDAWQSDGRFRGIMPNPNAIGLLTAIYAPLLIFGWLRFRSIISLLVLILAFAALLFSGSRNGFLSVSVGIIYLIVTSGMRRIFVIGFSAFAVIGLIALLGNVEELIANIPVIDRLIQPVGADFSGGRFESWASILQAIEARPLLGYGFGVDAIGNAEFVLGTLQAVSAHNSYISIVFQLGLIGLIMSTVPVVALLFMSMHSNPQTNQTVHIRILRSVIISGLVAAVFETWTLAVGNAFTFPFWICVMLLVRQLSLSTTTEATT